MKTFRFALVLIGLLAALPASAAPKHIIISDSLLANADPWDVKRGGHWMGINKWRFGDYAVVTSKVGWTHSRTTTNGLTTRTERHTGKTFSFVLSSRSADSAFVDVAHDITATSQPGHPMGKGWTVGGNAQVAESDLFVASILVNRDTTETWALTIGSTDVTNEAGEPRDDAGTHSATLTQGARRIALNPVFSRKLSEHPSLVSGLKLQLAPPAMGYEFIEDGRSLCALEYFSSGLSGSFKNTVWMSRNLDARLQLVLAAAMTALLEFECTAIEGPAGPVEQE
jgi:hypothetical protein